MKKIILILVTVILCSCSVKKNASNKTLTPLLVKVMTYNIHHANPPSKPGLIDLDAVAAVINVEKPDLVGLQEVDQFTRRSGNIDQAKLLAQKTGLHYQFFKAIDYDGGAYGIAILSKFPILSSSKVDLPQVMKGEERVMANIMVSLPNKNKVIFANTHLDAQRPDSNRVVQMKSILKELDGRSEATLLVGDLNCEAGKEPITLLDKNFTRSCLLNCAATIPEIKPVKTIDYIALKNAKWEVKEHKVIPETYASDHRPVIVVYQVK